MNLRRFTSLVITFAFLIMTYTGIMLFITPKGRIANWVNWEILGLSKEQYGALHVTFMVLFLVGMALHIWLNWGPLMSYLKNKRREFTLLTKEFGLALGFTVLFVVGTLAQIAPFQTFLDFEESVKVSWETGDNEPPYGHAELSSLKTFSKRIGQDVEKAIALLEAKGIKGATPGAKLQEIADFNGIAPHDIYTIIDPDNLEEANERPTHEEPTGAKTSTITMPEEGSGLGKMTLEEVSQKYGVDLNKAITILKAKGITADKSSRMRQTASELGTTPYDLFEMFIQ